MDTAEGRIDRDHHGHSLADSHPFILMDTETKARVDSLCRHSNHIFPLIRTRRKSASKTMVPFSQQEAAMPTLDSSVAQAVAVASQ